MTRIIKTICVIREIRGFSFATDLFSLKVLGERFGAQLRPGRPARQAVPRHRAARLKNALTHELTHFLVAGINDR